MVSLGFFFNVSVTGSIYLPNSLEDVGGKGGHPWRSTCKLHQHGQKLEERICSLSEEMKK